MYKIINDPIHGQITLHPLCMQIVDTPQFQRLRRIKQCGFTYTVYPSANHDRFSHSLGVAHLAGKFLRELLNNSEDKYAKEIKKSDVLCVEIAGLCHDLGHGPYSHFWEVFMEESTKRRRRGEGFHWKHEEVSLNLLDYLVRKNNLEVEFKKNEVNLEHVKNFIMGKTVEGKPYFLSQIVNNNESGLDVDKWDYYLRDCYHLGMQCGFEYERLVRCAKVKEVDGKVKICFRDKVKPMVYNMFRTRNELHHLAYQHRVVNMMEEMVVNALLEIDEKDWRKELFRNCGMDERGLWDLTRATVMDIGHNNTKLMKARDEALDSFCELTDDFIYFLMSKLGNGIVDCIESRSKKSNFYKFVTQWNIGETEKILGVEPGEIDIREKQDNIAEKIADKQKDFKKEDIIVQVISMHWGKKKENPIKSVTFYSKNDDIITHEKDAIIEWMQPTKFLDIQVRILCKNPDVNVDKVRTRCEVLRAL